MNPTDRDAPHAAEGLFADFLEQVESGSPADFDALCAEHPAHDRALRAMHVRWLALTQAFTALSRTGGGAVDAVSATVESLMARLRASPGRFARYAIGSELARGAMGRVVQAWDEELRRDVALKIQREAGGDTRLQRRFLEEAQITGQLDHPGIVPIHELGLDGSGMPFFAMRLVRGRDLADVLECVRDGRDGWTRTRVLHVLLRVCEAMAYAHDKGVVHRDLKPGNVMVGRFGETYVMDWGLARVVGRDDASDVDTLRGQIAEESAASPLLTQHGDVVGTPAYMAPEQATGGDVPIGPAVDVYALGAILYHLCAGHMPHAPASALLTARDVLARVREASPPSLRDDVPAELRAIQERAMARDPGQRYPSVEALAEDLRAYLELRVVKAYATGRFAELHKWIARNRALSAASGVAILALAVGVVVSTRLWMTADATAAQLTAELDRSEFRNARLSLGTDDSGIAEDVLWRQHFEGRAPRATHWALAGLHARTPCLATVPQPAGGQGPIVFVPGASEVVFGGGDGKLHVHDATTLAPRRVVGTSGPAIQSLAVSRSGDRMLVGSIDGVLTIVEPASGTTVRRFDAHPGGLRALAFAPDDRSFATGGADGRVLLWRDEAAEAVEVARHDAPVWTLAFDHDGKRLGSGDELGWVRILDFASGASSRWRVANDNAMGMSFTPGVDELWVGSADHNVHVMTTSPWGRVKRIASRNGTVRDLLRDDDGSLLVGGWWRIDRYSADGLRVEPVALRGVWQFDLDRASRRLVASHLTTGLSLFDLSSRGEQRIAGNNFGLSGDGRRIAIDVGGAIVIRSVDGSESMDPTPVHPHGGWVTTNHDGSLVAVMHGDPLRVEVVDVATRTLRCRLDGPEGAPFNECFAFRPDGRELAVITGRDLVRRVDPVTGELRGEHRFDDGAILRIRYSHDGRTLAVLASRLAAVRRISLADGTHVDDPFPATPIAFALSPDGARVACGMRNGRLFVRELAAGTTREIHAHSGVIWSLSFSPVDSGLLISSGGANGVAFWDLDSGLACHNGSPDEAPVAQMQLSRDGRTWAAFTNDGVVLRDLEYHERHVAGNLEHQLEKLGKRVAIPPSRERELREWARAVLARPWPRWR